MKKLAFALLFLLAATSAWGCTSLIASGRATASGRPLLWKHRDTSATNNFLYRVEANPSAGRKFGFVGLFNGADSLVLDEAWMGMNDAGFAIMNTVAYNLPKNSPDYTDREGVLMARALGCCATVDDFAAFLDTLPKPMGVQTNFGVIDAAGNGAYFETDDHGYKRFDSSDSPTGVLIRTNYAYSGKPDAGMGYIRHANVEHILGHAIETGSLTPASLTDGVSRSFYNSALGYDALEVGDRWAVDMDFVPRYSSTASIAVEGILPGEDPSAMIMWANVGYPPCSYTDAVTLTDIPADFGPTSPDGAYSPAGLEARRLMTTEVFPLKKRGNGKKYINLHALAPILEQNHAKSLTNYARSSKRKQHEK